MNKMMDPKLLFLYLRKYKIGSYIIKVPIKLQHLEQYMFNNNKVFEASCDNHTDVSFGLTSKASILDYPPVNMDRKHVPIGHDWFLVLPNIVFFAAGQMISMDYLPEEDEDMRNHRIRFIYSAVDHGTHVKDAIQYSKFHVNNITYGTRYESEIEDKLDRLRAYL